MTADRIGRYTILRQLGEGGMATVYLAHDPEMERQVAVKVLARQFLNDPEFRARFKREARLIAALDHSAIVPIFDYGDTGEQPYIAMRYLPGGTLAERLTGQPVTLEAAIAILDRLAQALDAAHQKGIIHRDLKPGNVLFDADGYAFLSDFGIAKLTQGSTAYTTTGFIGTPEYIDPEQAEGNKDLDARSDIYSLGVIAYQLLTGRKPFTGDTPMRVMYKHVHDPVPPIDTRALRLPAKVNAVMLKALAKKPEARYTSAGELAAALRALLPASGKTPPPVKPPTKPLTPARTPPKESTPTWKPTAKGSSTADSPDDHTRNAPPVSPILPPVSAPPNAIPWWLWGMGIGLPIMFVALMGLGLTWMVMSGNRRTPTPTVTTTRTAPPAATATHVPPSATPRASPTFRATASPTFSLTVEPTFTPTSSPTPTRRAPANTPRPPTIAPTATLPPTVAPTLPPPTDPPPPPPPATVTPVFNTPTPVPSSTPVQDTPTPALQVEQ